MTNLLGLVFRNHVLYGYWALPVGVTSWRVFLQEATPDLANFIQSGGEFRHEVGRMRGASFIAHGRGWKINGASIVENKVVGIGEKDRIESPEGIKLVFVGRPNEAGVMKGRFEQIRMDGLITLLGEQNHTGGIRIGAGEGMVWLENGLVVGAKTFNGSEIGESAFGRMVLLEEGEFEVFSANREEIEKNIHHSPSNMDLMLRACQKRDEGVGGSRSKGFWGSVQAAFGGFTG
jgi:hypothetical protein